MCRSWSRGRGACCASRTPRGRCGTGASGRPGGPRRSSRARGSAGPGWPPSRRPFSKAGGGSLTLLLGRPGLPTAYVSLQSGSRDKSGRLMECIANAGPQVCMNKNQLLSSKASSILRDFQMIEALK